MPLNAARLPLIAVIGDREMPASDPRLDLARDCGQALVDAGFRVVTGSLGGIMAAACEGAHRAARYAPGATVALLPGFDPETANPWADVVIATGLEVSRNVLVANSDAVVAIGGGVGTLSEMALAWQLQRLVIGLRVPGWSGTLADRPMDARVRYPDIPDDRVYGADAATDVVAILRAHLARYTRRHVRCGV